MSSTLAKSDFNFLNPHKQVMVERSREKFSWHQISRITALYGWSVFEAIKDASLLYTTLASYPCCWPHTTKTIKYQWCETTMLHLFHTLVIYLRRYVHAFDSRSWWKGHDWTELRGWKRQCQGMFVAHSWTRNWLLQRPSYTLILISWTKSQLFSW